MGEHPAIEPSELQKALQGQDPPFVLDVREPYELEISCIGCDCNMPLAEVAFQYESLPSQREIVVVCRSGNRSGMVTQFLRKKGLRATNLSGGINRWAEEVDPSLPKY